MASNKKTTRKEQANKKQETALANLTDPVEFLGSKKLIIDKYVAPHTTGTSIVRSALMAFEENWKLQEALKTPAGRNSVYHSMLRAASTGLSLNPLEGKAALVPYSSKKDGKWETTVTYQIMKNGIIELALLSGQVEHISADTIREEDDFRINKTGAGDDFHFAPALKGRGEIVGFYASVKLKSGALSVAYMSWDEIDDHRNKYSSSYRKDLVDKTQNSPWSHSEEGMGIKTVLKKLFRNFYISPEISKAVAADDEGEGITVIEVEAQKTSAPDDIAKQLNAKEAKAELENENGKVIDTPPASVKETETNNNDAGF